MASNPSREISLLARPMVTRMRLYKDPEWLFEQHWGCTMTQTQMAELADCCQRTIGLSMDRLGIPKRSQKEAAEVMWKNDEYRSKQRFTNSTERRKRQRSATSKKLWQSESHRRFMSSMSLKLWQDEEYRRTHTEDTKRWWLNADYRNNVVSQWTPERRKKMSRESSEWIKKAWQCESYRNIQTETHKGERNPMWNGGSSFEPYSPEFNGQFKKRIRRRDNYRCSICGVVENGAKHHVHHIDYVKKNTTLWNCITLCSSCHMGTNVHRDFWQEKLTFLMRGITRIPIL